MNDNTKIMKSINELLQGEYMAIESFNNFIYRLEDGNEKNALKSIQKQHRENIEILANYMQDEGGQPDENLGIKGIMGDIKLICAKVRNKFNVSIAEVEEQDIHKTYRYTIQHFLRFFRLRS